MPGACHVDLHEELKVKELGHAHLYFSCA